MIKIYSEINIKEILNSGECFRQINELDGSITTILKDRVVNLKQNKNEIIIKSNNENNLKEIMMNYLNLNINFEKINLEILKNNSDLKNIIAKCKNYRTLNQDKFETSISYIISQNNNVKRISKSINELSKKYGTKIIFEDKEYYLFPTYDQIKNITVEEIQNLKIGFRDKYIKSFLDNYESLKNLEELNTSEALKELMKIKGIGLKVASCILLFSYGRFDVFPIDTWVKKYMIERYNLKNDIKEIQKYSCEHFGKYSGLVLQYFFHVERNK